MKIQEHTARIEDGIPRESLGQIAKRRNGRHRLLFGRRHKSFWDKLQKSEFNISPSDDDEE